VRAATPDYETTVLTVFSHQLQAYCAAANRDRRARPPIVLVISVVTAAHLDGLRERLAEFAGRILSRELPAARLDGLYFAVDPAMTEPQCHIGIDDRMPVPPAGRADSVHYPPRLLTLAFGPAHRFVFPLVVGPAWLAVRRGRPAADLRYEISLPEHFIAVPAGTLLQLRYEPGRVDLRRTDERTEYTVAVDGVALAPWQSVELGGGGSITYANGSGRSALRYVLMERQ